jgi:BirA family biotin operon repressor/biotin-[acetyl-CoA-carboxylase] ligase
MHKTTRQTIRYARQLRKDMTDAEFLLWSKIRGNQLGVKFRKQVPAGRYIIDFYSYDCNLAIELDGSQHLDNHEYDAIRTEYLESQNIKVLRFWNHEVLTNIESLLTVIQRNIETQCSEVFPIKGMS